MTKDTNKAKFHLLHCFFWIYFIVLIYFLLLSERTEYTYYRYNLVLFQEINRFLNGSKYFNTKEIMLNLLGNVIGFVPLGFILPIIRRKKAFSFVCVIFVFLFSLTIEMIQLVFRIGVFDVDDLLLNTLGGFIGYVIYLLWQCISNVGRRKKGHEK